MVRTTVVLDEGLSRRIRNIAHRKGHTFRRTIVELLQAGLSEGKEKKKPVDEFRLRTFRSQAQVEINDRNALFEIMGGRLG